MFSATAIICESTKNWTKLTSKYNPNKNNKLFTWQKMNATYSSVFNWLFCPFISLACCYTLAPYLITTYCQIQKVLRKI